MEPQKHPKKTNKGLQTAAKLSGIGIQMGITIYLGNLLGAWLDKKFEANYLEIVITLIAIFVATYAMIRQANNLNN
ncbi:AtpZ/AtpI family protein [Cellulophaga baltica]|uniref:AtpZ/AtpI family protein n=1 Tax=Cellulophaga TaxID=104264 RepID=UPI001C065E21|nr:MULTISPECIES: AtpZ/AtpI family protein [Cellulophaga]MBU2995945.1 AtpZ/AtpI family protein [Cellulophaga baltica]MDO6767340.1 AtpZ/AtpI family protein [Cellulophaga sp. 1_MG-2023]